MMGGLSVFYSVRRDAMMEIVSLFIVLPFSSYSQKSLEISGSASLTSISFSPSQFNVVTRCLSVISRLHFTVAV